MSLTSVPLHVTHIPFLCTLVQSHFTELQTVLWLDILFATLFSPGWFFVMVKERGEGHQQGDDVQQQTKRIPLISKQTVHNKVRESLRIEASLRKLGSPSCPQHDTCITENRIVIVICVIAN